MCAPGIRVMVNVARSGVMYCLSFWVFSKMEGKDSGAFIVRMPGLVGLVWRCMWYS